MKKSICLALQKFLFSIYFPCLIVLAVFILVMALLCRYFPEENFLYDFLMAMFTGVIASIGVSLFFHIRSEREKKIEKMAKLLDARAAVTFFFDKYNKLNKNDYSSDNERILVLLNLCEEPAKYIIKTFESNPSIFDVVEMEFVREIRSSLYFLKMLIPDFETFLQSSPEKALSVLEEIKSISPKAIEKISKLLCDIREGLFCLKIKWDSETTKKGRRKKVSKE